MHLCVCCLPPICWEDVDLAPVCSVVIPQLACVVATVVPLVLVFGFVTANVWQVFVRGFACYLQYSGKKIVPCSLRGFWSQ